LADILNPVENNTKTNSEYKYLNIGLLIFRPPYFFFGRETYMVLDIMNNTANIRNSTEICK